MSRRWEKAYPKRISTEIEIPSMNIYQVLDRSEKDYPHHIAVIDEEEQWTYTQLKTKAEQLANSLHELGFQKGDRMAVMFPNSKEYIVSFFAIQRLGGTVVQVNPMYQQGELEYILENSGARWFIGEYSQREKLRSLPYCEGMKKIYNVQENEVLNEEEYSIYTLIERTVGELSVIEIDPTEDIAVLQYTGGTTGKSKGVMLTHFNIIANIYQSYFFNDGKYERPGERVLSVSPFFHVYGMTSAMSVAIFAAGTVICLKRFTVEKTLDLMRKHRPTIFPGVPTMYIALLHHPDSSPEVLKSIKICNSGSAPMPVELMKEFEGKTGATIVEGYGLSEASPVTHRNPITGVKKAGSIGVPLPGTDAKVVDQETGTTELVPGDVGELVIKGPQVMKGYWNNEQETFQTIRDGWLYTGDLATMDEDGYFYIVGRKKDMILASGYNIYPAEIEEILYRHPAIAEVCVFGVPDTYRGETVRAVIVLKNGHVITEEEILHWCQTQMAKYKVPKSISFRTELPKTTVGKILRRKLIDEEIERVKG